MDYIFRNENTRHLYHTSGNILSTLDTIFLFFSQHLSPHQQDDHHNPMDSAILTIYSPHSNILFQFINPSWILNIKRQLVTICWRDIESDSIDKKIINLIPTNNQLIENTDKATCPMTKRHPEINRYLLSNLLWYLAPKKYWKKVWERLFWYLCQFRCLVLCNTWWNWFHSRLL